MTAAITSVPIVATVRQGTIRGVRTVMLVWLPETPDDVTLTATGPCGERTYTWPRATLYWLIAASAGRHRDYIQHVLMDDGLPMSITMPLNPVARMLAATYDVQVAELAPDMDAELTDLLGGAL